MLTPARNELLTRVGPGTPMGNLLRRYWMPIAGASELAVTRIKPIRLLCEDLALYKDLGGRYGLVARHCAHRGADLSCGTVEETGLRCFYHGWKFDQVGACIEQPYEEVANSNPKSRDGCAIAAYPVRELAGLLWTYMGPAPIPELPVWEPFTFLNGFREIVTANVPCNWFQCQENSIDPVHFEWMHDNWSARLAAKTRSPLVISRSHMTSSSTVSSTGASARAPTSAIRTGRLAEWPVAKRAFISACISNGACRSTTRTRSASAGSSCDVPKGTRTFRAGIESRLVSAGEGRRPGDGSSAM